MAMYLFQQRSLKTENYCQGISVAAMILDLLVRYGSSLLSVLSFRYRKLKASKRSRTFYLHNNYSIQHHIRSFDNTT